MDREDGLVTRISPVTAAVLCLAWGAGSLAIAADPWEFPPVGGGDDSVGTKNTLSHGLVQQHDLDEAGAGARDVDWMLVPTAARHSYEARVSGASLEFKAASECSACPHVQLVAPGGSVNRARLSVAGFPSNDRTITGAYTSPAQFYIRVLGPQSGPPGDANAVYTIRYWDTTYSIPRWNSVGSQQTVFLLSNITNRPVQVRIDLYDASGALLAEAPLS